MPDVSSTAPEQVRLWVALDVHKFSIVAATLPAQGGSPGVQRIQTNAAAIGRFIRRLGGPAGLAVCYEAGPGGYELLRLLTRLGVACDVVAPSLVPVRAGDRVKTDRRDAKKLVRLYRAGELRFVAPPSPAHEGLRDLVRCRQDIGRARTAARHQVAKQLLRHAGSFAGASRPGRCATRRGSAASSSMTPSRSARSSTRSRTWAASRRNWRRSTESSSRWRAASRGQTRCAR